MVGGEAVTLEIFTMKRIQVIQDRCLARGLAVRNIASKGLAEQYELLGYRVYAPLIRLVLQCSVLGVMIIALLFLVPARSSSTEDTGTGDSLYVARHTSQEVDWTRRIITFRGRSPFPLPRELQVVAVPWQKPGAELPKVQQLGPDEWQVTGSPEAIFSAISQGTRSLWIGNARKDAADVPFRVDLLPIDISSVGSDRSERDGLVVNLGVKNLLPGFRVYAAFQHEGDARPSTPKPLPYRAVAKSRPYVVGIRVDKAETTVSIAMPSMDNNKKSTTYFLTVANADSSRSQLLKFVFRGNKLARGAGLLSDAQYAPVDERLPARTVEGRTSKVTDAAQAASGEKGTAPR